MLLGHYLELLRRAELRLATALHAVADGHGEEPDVAATCAKLARDCERHAEALGPFARSYDDPDAAEPPALHSDLFGGPRDGGLGLLRDLHDLYLMATECDLVWTLVGQAAQGARDERLLDVVARSEGETAMQLRWLSTRLKQAAPQALVVAG